MPLEISHIPTSTGVSHYSQVTTLSGVQYLLRMDWVQRWQRWTLSISSTDGTSLLSGSPLVTGADLLAHVRHDDRLPPGSLIVYDMQSLGGDPSLSDMSKTGSYVLLYIEDV